jgi:ubiquinone/menaquinone biosynthesis C-methylase UbiE
MAGEAIGREASMAGETRDFSKEAATWDTPGRVKVALDVADAIVRAVPLSPEMDVLDFGCGTGTVSLHLQPHVRRITGVDSARGMLEAFEAKARERGVTNVSTCFVDVEAGDSLEGEYDLVLCSMALHHIRDAAAMVAEFARVLRPGGRLAIADLDPEEGRFHEDATGVFHDGFDRGAMKGMLEAAGLEDVTVGTATEVVKPDRDGTLSGFSVFLAVGRKA